MYLGLRENHYRQFEKKLYFSISSNTNNSIPITSYPTRHLLTDKARELFITEDIEAKYAHLVQLEKQAVEARRKFLTDTFENIKPQLEEFVSTYKDTYPEEFI